MNAVEMMIAFLMLLVAWLGAEVTAMFSDAESNTKFFAMEIRAEDDPILARTSPGFDYSWTGRIYSGTFILGDGPIMNDGVEWWEIQADKFGPHYVWIPVDYNRMSTVWVRRDKIISYGKDEVY